jgi:hypothetical protein
LVPQKASTENLPSYALLAASQFFVDFWESYPGEALDL